MWIITTIVFAVAFLGVIFWKNSNDKISKAKLVEKQKKVSECMKKMTDMKIRNSEEVSTIMAENISRSKKAEEQHKSELKKLNDTIESLQKGLDLYKEQYRRALVLHPGLDNEIDKMIKEEVIMADIDKANEFDTAAGRFDGVSANRYIVEELEQVIIMYNKLTSAQKHYVVSDIQKIYNLYSASFNLQKKYLKKKEEENASFT